MGFDDWPPKPAPERVDGSDPSDVIFGGHHGSSVVTPERPDDEPDLTDDDEPDLFMAPGPEPAEPSLSDDLFGPAPAPAAPARPGPTVDAVSTSRARTPRLPRARRSMPKLSKPSLGAAGAGLSSAGMQDVVRIVAAVAVAGLVWLVVDRAADVTGVGQFIVTATAAAVTMAVMYARGPKLGLAVAAVCAVVAVVSAHWWWAAAAVLMVLGGILTAGWRKDP